MQLPIAMKIYTLIFRFPVNVAAERWFQLPPSLREMRVVFFISSVHILVVGNFNEDILLLVDHCERDEVDQ